MAARPRSVAAALLLLLAVPAALADGGGGGGGGHRRKPSAGLYAQLPVRVFCKAVHGVAAGETCASVARAAGLDGRAFMDLNPNVTCSALFPGQWLCVSGALTG